MKEVTNSRSVGFSGSRNGMSKAQISKVGSLLDGDSLTRVAGHGDCQGADEDFHKLCSVLGLYLIGHPPDNDKFRAFCKFDEVRESKSYLERNLDIVNESDWLIFTPNSYIEILRSGTWMAIRRAKKKRKEGFIVWPDGSITTLEEWESVF